MSETITRDRAPSGQDDGRADLLIRHAFVITMDDQDNVFPDGAVAVRGAEIIAVGPDGEIARRFSAERTIDAKGAPVHPGLIDTHVHASYHLYRGLLHDSLCECDVFDAFLQRYVDNVEAAEEYQAVRLACIEMIRNGTTCFVEAGTVFEPAAAAEAAQEVGLRAILADPFLMDLPGGYSQGTSGSSPHSVITRAPQNLEQAAERMGRELWRNNDPEALVTAHIALRGLGTASRELLVLAKKFAADHGTILNMHQSYSPADHEADCRKFGCDPLLGLERLGILDSGLLLGHANYLVDNEVGLAIRSRVGISWAPAASMMWGHRSALQTRHAEVWCGGGHVSLGSDSGNWSNSFDVFRQANLGVLVSRAAHGDRSILSSADALRMATIGGARAIGMQDRLGSLEAGKRADIVVHSLRRPELLPSAALWRNLIYASGAKSVHTVLVNGRVVLEAGEFPALDEAAALDAFDRTAAAFIKRIGYRPLPDRAHRM